MEKLFCVVLPNVCETDVIELFAAGIITDEGRPFLAKSNNNNNSIDVYYLEPDRNINEDDVENLIKEMFEGTPVYGVFITNIYTIVHNVINAIEMSVMMEEGKALQSKHEGLYISNFW